MPTTEQTAMHPSLTSSHTGTFYFAFGSNLSAHQMSIRLSQSPSSSVPVALAYLPSYTWIICSRGYANVVKLAPSNAQPSHANTVWGIIYNMSTQDEARLDRYEGHDDTRNPDPELNPDPATQLETPYLQGGWDYNKHYLPLVVTKWLRDPHEYGVQTSQSTTEPNAEKSVAPTPIRALVYVDEHRTQPGTINAEYIGRMNRGIDEAVKLGMPEAWVDAVMRKWIPKGIYVDHDGYVGTDQGYVEAEATETLDEVKEKQVREWRESQGGGWS